MLAPSQADDVPRAQGSLSHLRVTALPKGEPRHRILAIRNGAYLYRYAPFTVLRLPSMRVPPESRMVVNGFRPGTPLPLLWERWPSAARTERANNGNVQSEKCWHLRRQMTSRGRKAPLSHLVVTALPKGEPRHRILAQEMERICIDTLHSLFYGYPQCACRPKVGWS